jgi:hypothetical protein
MAGTPMPMPWFTGLDASGAPVGGGLLYTYAAGTTTPLETFTDAALTVAHPNPVVLDSAGRAAVFLQPSAYKFVLRTASGTLIREQDNILASGAATTGTNADVSGIAGEALTLGNLAYLSDGAGGRVAGQWYKASGATAAYSVEAPTIGVVQGTVSAGAAVTVRVAGKADIAGLTPGSLYYVGNTAGAVSAAAGTYARVVGRADTTTTLVLGGAHLAVQETVIVDGALLARLAADETVAGLWAFTQGLKERGRTAPMGEWTDVAFNAANYGAGGGTWTVTAPDVGRHRYAVVGKHVTLQVTISGTVAGSPTSLTLNPGIAGLAAANIVAIGVGQGPAFEQLYWNFGGTFTISRPLAAAFPNGAYTVSCEVSLELS